MLFKDFRECRLVVLEWETYFDNKAWNNIYKAVLNADMSNIPDKNKIWSVSNAIIDGLWNNAEAEEIGYREWIIKKRQETLDMFEYYRNNPEEELK